jgi:hypothetical protein
MHTTISRREMLRVSAGLLAAGVVSPLQSAVQAEARKSVYLPSLHERAHLAIQCLTTHCDASRGYVPYFYTRMSDRPPAMFLAIWSYGDGMGRSLDALALLRHMTGGGLDQPADRSMRAALIGLLGEDGLSWCPAEPWLMPTPHTRPSWLQQGALLAFTTLFQLTGDPQYKHYIERIIQALDQRLIRKPGLPATFPGDTYTHLDGWGPASTEPTEPFLLYCASVTMPLLRYYRLTGYEPAFRLASELTDGAVQAFGGGEKFFELGHFHCESRIMISLLQRGIIKHNAADLELGEKLYRKARALGTQSGWFPEQVNNPANNRSNLSETCSLTDMLETAILLARHRNAAYWDDAERYVRNHLLVHQIVDVGWEKEMTTTPLEKHPLRFPGDDQPITEGGVRGNTVMRSLIGGFAGWGGATAMSDDSTFSNSNQHCCNAAGARAIYDAWSYAVTEEAGSVSINLHVHRNHAAVEVVAEEALSPEPLGVLRVKVKQQRQLRVRIPEFLGATEMHVRLNGGPAQVRESGAFLDIGSVRPGDLVEATYPMKARTTEERIALGVFSFHWRGATVSSASPRQKIRPLFVDDRFLSAPPDIGPAPGREYESL